MAECLFGGELSGQPANESKTLPKHKTETESRRVMKSSLTHTGTFMNARLYSRLPIVTHAFVPAPNDPFMTTHSHTMVSGRSG